MHRFALFTALVFASTQPAFALGIPCGGDAKLVCPKGSDLSCVDIPDDCDPSAGDLGCMGHCVPVEPEADVCDTVLCAAGYACLERAIGPVCVPEEGETCDLGDEDGNVLVVDAKLDVLEGNGLRRFAEVTFGAGTVTVAFSDPDSAVVLDPRAGTVSFTCAGRPVADWSGCD